MKTNPKTLSKEKQLLAKKLKHESELCREESMKVLKEFDIQKL